MAIALPFICAEIVLVSCIIRYTACYSKARVQRRLHKHHLSTKRKQSEKMTPRESGRASERAGLNYHHVTGKERAQDGHHNKGIERNDEIKLKVLSGGRNTSTSKSTRNAQLDDYNSPIHDRGREDRAENTPATNRHTTTSVPSNVIAQNVTRTQTTGENYRQKAEPRQIEVEIHEYEHNYETINTTDSEQRVYATVTESISQSHPQHGCLANKYQNPSHQQRDHVMTDDGDVLSSNKCLTTTFDKSQSPSEKDDEHVSNDSNTPSQQDYTYVNNNARYTYSSKHGERVLSESKESSSQANQEPMEIQTTTNAAYLCSRINPQANDEATSTCMYDNTECRYDHNGSNTDNQRYYENCSLSESQQSNEKQMCKTDKHAPSTAHDQPASSVALTGTVTYDKWGRLYSDC